VNTVTHIGETTFRNERKRFGIRQADRRFHAFIIGKTGTGKSTLLKSMILQDIAAGRGVALFDPHGDLVADVIERLPAARRRDTVHLDTPAGNWTFNPLADVPAGQEALAVAELVEVFKKIWTDEWGPRLEHLFRHVLFTLLEVPNATLADAQPLLTDRTHRRGVVSRLTNEDVRAFWQGEFEAMSPAFRAVVTAPLLNKLGAFLTDVRLRTILTSANSSFDLRAIMDEGHVLLVNLSRGQIGEGPAMLLGALLVAKIGLAGLARASQRESERRDFVLYLDEAHIYATRSLATMFSELRKYRVPLVLASQYLGQFETDVRDAVLGNVGTLISFRVGADDAQRLSREFMPTFAPEDLVRLPNRQIYLRLMIDGEVSKPFSAITLPA
jgi:DNA helicase HerA-like ATPase